MVRIHPDPPECNPGFRSGNSGAVKQAAKGRPGFEKRADQGGSRRRVDRLLHKAASNAERRSLSKAEGAVAQLGEHLLCKQGVVGSIPSSSTNPWADVEQRMQKQALRFASGFLNQ